MRTPIALSCCLLLAALVLSGGCAQQRVNLVANGTLGAEAHGSDMLDVARPAAYYEDGVLEVTGTVKRKPGVVAAVPGHIDLFILDKDGKQLEYVPLAWSPTNIPVTEPAQATYTLRYAWKPPAGALVRVGHSTERTWFAQAPASYAVPGDAGLVQWGTPGAPLYMKPSPRLDPVDTARNRRAEPPGRK